MRAAAAGSHVVCEIWSGPEFEERLRRDCESLLQRFVSGVTFPDSSAELTAFVRSVGGATDREIATALARTFDRPAFYTPFQNEGSIPDFRDALDETIRTLGTGQRRTRDGKDLRPIHSRHDIADSALRDTFAAIERAVAGLRARFDQLLRAGEIRRCADACRNPRCTLYFMSDTAIADMNQIRATILDALRGAVPEVRLRVDWSHEFGG
jgi:hypothetical protein